VLGGTKGVLVVDGYTGYSQVTKVEGRVRAGCLAHARRKLFEAKDQAPEVKEALELILDIYEVEHEAKDLDIIGTDAHLKLRQERSRPIMKKFHDWLSKQKALHPPKSKMGVAIGYALKNWKHLEVFLVHARVPVDNNKSERSLRIAALGRRNFLFVGNEGAGKNLAGLYSLVATCVANGVNPEEYLADVIMRLHNHPAKDIADLLPQNWSKVA
jgi:transposase